MSRYDNHSRSSHGRFVRSPGSPWVETAAMGGLPLGGPFSGAFARASASESFKLLERVLDEQFEVVESAQAGATVEVKEPKKDPSDCVQNPSDPDASYIARRGQGYAAQMIETYVEDDEDDLPSGPDLTPYGAVQKMTVHDAGWLCPATRGIHQFH